MVGIAGGEELVGLAYWTGGSESGQGRPVWLWLEERLEWLLVCWAMRGSSSDCVVLERLDDDGPFISWLSSSGLW